ncbi:MAG TPA: DUF1569 domain-containing protein [Vicinamibacterales bacterium]|jgi:hypothetical protein
MKTMARADCRAEIVRRLEHLSPSSERRWGRMSAPQMVCHLIDSFRMMTGETPVSDASSRFQRTVTRCLALYVPIQWPRGFATRPEIDQEFLGTRPGEFATDRALLASLVEPVCTSTSVEHPAHPVFGRMSHAAWLRWAYLHMDHHLRQFGV